MEYVDLSSFSPELLCGVCHLPFVEPLLAPCEHIICRACFPTGKSECPQCGQECEPKALPPAPKQLVSLADKAEVYCQFRTTGPCAWKGERRLYSQHVSSCTLAGAAKYEYVLSDDKIDEELKCSVCLQPWIDPVQLPCEHVYCRACAVKSLKGSETGECALCKASFTEAKLVKAPRQLVNMVERLEVTCPKKCGWCGVRSSVGAHISACAGVVSALSAVSKNEFPCVGMRSDAPILTMLHIEAPPIPESERAKRKPLCVSAVIDVSGSMAGSKIQLVRESLEFVVKELSDKDELGIIAFDDKVEVTMPLTHMNAQGQDSAFAAIKTLNDRGSTNLSGGLLAGIDQVRRQPITLAEPAAEETRPRTGSILNRLSSLVSSKPTNNTKPRTKSPPPVAGAINVVWLFTDGQANAGITDPTQLITALKTKLSSHTSDVVVYTFGFGSDHNANLLSGIAEATQGSYYFVKDTSVMKESFADCLGGLVSIVAQNIKLELTCAEGVNVKRVLTTYPSTLVGSTLAVTLKDLYSEEKRDILVELNAGAAISALGNKVPLGTWKISYTNALRGAVEGVTRACVVDVVDAVPAGLLPDTDVDAQKNRFLATEALEKANDLAAKGNVQAAQAELQCLKAAMMCAPSAKTAEVMHLMDDLCEAEECTASVSVYQSQGSKKMKAMWGGHAQQRCNSSAVDNVYATSSKCAMKSKVSK